MAGGQAGEVERMFAEEDWEQIIREISEMDGTCLEVFKVMPMKKMDIQYILDSMASSNVAPGIMRTFSHARFPGG